MAITRPDFENVSELDLRELKANEIAEGIQLEYKQAIYEQSDAHKFLKAVSSFANTAGGHVIIGVPEDEGLPRDIIGVADDLDAEKSRLENL
jgi:predicted HTH transcriptional regulator